jgi:hypothetical protein
MSGTVCSAREKQQSDKTIDKYKEYQLSTTLTML